MEGNLKSGEKMRWLGLFTLLERVAFSSRILRTARLDFDES
jgi:hypothetical protein